MRSGARQRSRFVLWRITTERDPKIDKGDGTVNYFYSTEGIDPETALLEVRRRFRDTQLKAARQGEPP